MKRREITASSVLLGLALMLLATCAPPAHAAEIYIDVQSDRAAPRFHAIGAPPHRSWGHEMPLLEVRPLGNQTWRLRTRYPDEWGCAIFWITEAFAGEAPEDPGFVVTSENAIQFGTCPEPPLTPVSEPPPDLMVRAATLPLAALLAWRRPAQPRA